MPLSVYRVNYFTPAIEEQLMTIYKDWPAFSVEALKQGQLYVAEFNQRLLGAALLREDQLCYVSVRSVTRGREVGSELVGYIEEGAALSYSHLKVDTKAFPDAETFFLKLGYQKNAQGWLEKNIQDVDVDCESTGTSS